MGSQPPRIATQEFAQAVVARLDGPSGIVLFSGFSALAEELREHAFGRLCSLFGDLMPQRRNEQFIREVRDRGTQIGEGATARYSDSRFGGSLHTDGAQAPQPVPDYFALFCIRDAHVGGELQLISVRAIERRLADRPALLATLYQEFHFDRRGDQGDGETATTRKAVLFRYRGRTAVTYLREYIEAGHRHADIPDLTADQVAALDALDAELADRRLVIEGRLAPGDVIVIDNTRFLHGRTEFLDSAEGEGRLLLRAWLRRRK
jgi:alpha-ketoglutarate-dependent taurine dioxygenase